MNNLALPICPKCGDTKHVKEYKDHVKLAQPYVCNNCKIYWATDLGIINLDATHFDLRDMPFAEQYESFVKMIVKLTNEPFSEWSLQFGAKVAQIHHNSHTWCFCNYTEAIKQINESKEPVYLGIMANRWKASQNNNLEPNEVILTGSHNVITKSVKIIVET